MEQNGWLFRKNCNISIVSSKQSNNAFFSVPLKAQLEAEKESVDVVKEKSVYT